jgi:hypothetical protein
MAKRSSTWDRALAPFKHLIIAQGEVTYAYNLLQESFFNLFVLTLNLERPPDACLPLAKKAKFYQHTLAIWHVSQNDRQQRQLVIAALASLPTTLDIKGGIARLEWAQKQTDKLSEYRNLIVHTPMRFRYPYPLTLKGKNLPTPIPDVGGFSTKPLNIRRLRLIKSTRFWKGLRNDLMNLNDYVDFVTRQIAWREYERRNGALVLGARHAWPRKPRLPSVRRIGLIENMAKNNPNAARSRRRRRRPSDERPPA